MGKDDIYESTRSSKQLMERDRLSRLISEVKNCGNVFNIPREDLIAWRKHTIELSYRLREKAMANFPDQGLGHPDFDNYYTKCFRELDNIELESMILSHEYGIHTRRPQTIKIIRDAYMNNLLMEDSDE